MSIDLLEKYKPLFEKSNTLDRDSPYRYFIITGGRGSGKSFHISLFLLNLTYNKGEVILFSRYTLTSAELSIIPEFVDKIELLGVSEDFTVTKKEIVNKKTGSKILFRGLKVGSGNQTANLKSIHDVTTFVLDEAEELVDENLFNKINRSIRSKKASNKVLLVMNSAYTTHFIYKNFFERRRDDTLYIHTTYLDNLKNLSDSFVQDANFEKNNRPHIYNHEFLGKWIDENEHSLFPKEYFKTYSNLPRLQNIILSIDVAVSSNKKSDETGIIVLGKGFDNNYYVIEDSTMKGKPDEWSDVIYKLVTKYNIRIVIAEKNQGGDLIESVLNLPKNVRYEPIHAKDSKKKRAEPVSLLYAKGLVLHNKGLDSLEMELRTFPSGKSPNAMDALVHGINWLQDNGRTFRAIRTI